MIVGQRIRRPDALEKVKGSALYIEDVAVAGALLAGVLRSPHAHARITRLDVFAARGLPGVHAVLTAADIPGQNLIPMIQNDWPVLADPDGAVFAVIDHSRSVDFGRAEVDDPYDD